MLSAIMASPAPNRYGRQSRLRSAANLAGGAVPAVRAVIWSDGATSSTSTTWVGMRQAGHMEPQFSGVGVAGVVRAGGGRGAAQPTPTVVLGQLVPQARSPGPPAPGVITARSGPQPGSAVNPGELLPSP